MITFRSAQNVLPPAASWGPKWPLAVRGGALWRYATVLNLKLLRSEELLDSRTEIMQNRQTAFEMITLASNPEFKRQIRVQI